MKMQDKTLPWSHTTSAVFALRWSCKFRPLENGSGDDGGETGRDYRVAGDDGGPREKEI